MRKIIKLRIHHVFLGTLLLYFIIIPISLCENNVKQNATSHNTSAVINKSVSETRNSTEKTRENNHIDKITKASDNSKSQKTHTDSTSSKIDSTSSSESSNDKIHFHSSELDTGAVTRAFYVLVGLSIIVVAYLTFRKFRLTKNPVQMVRKYGVLAHKQDIEIRPLPLDDDDDDDTTIFDASKLSRNLDQTV